MRHLYKISFIFILALAFACTDLDLQPQSTTTNAVLFKNPDSYRGFIAKVYAGLATTGQQGPAGDADIKGLDEGFSNYLRQYWQLQELPTEEAIIAWGDEGLQDLHNHVWTDGNQFVRAMYNRIFFQVSQANEFLRETTQEKLDSRGVEGDLLAEIQGYRAEARFLRAVSLWHGIDMYGNVPLYTEFDDIGSEPPAQSTRQDVYNFIVSELQDIEGSIAAPGQNEYGRADRAAVWMLQAKVYLNAEVYTGTGRYSECVEACAKVINSGIYSLEEDYDELFMTDNDDSPEFIWAIPFDGESTQTWGGMTYLVHAPLGGNMDPLAYGVNGGWFGLRTTSSFVDFFPDPSGTSDDRANFFTDGQNKSIASISNFNDGYAIIKFVNISSEGVGGSDLDHPDTDYPMFRLADAYLMYAEAVLRGGSGGDAGTALGYVNELRERAFGNATGNITAGGLTLDFILSERARELHWEGHRRTDLIRFNQFTENGVWPWKGGTQAGVTTEPFRRVFPIPASELLANSKLEQNDGY